MPTYRTLSRIAKGLWIAAVAAAACDLAGHEYRPVLALAIAGAATATILAAVTYLQASAITPVREAFIHGYELGTQHAAAVQAAHANPDLARVLRLPAAAWTVMNQQAAGEPATETEPEPQPDHLPRHRAPSPRRSP